MRANFERQYMINAKGKFMTHVNEIYLRDDISCGWAQCDEHNSKKNILNIENDDISRRITFFDTNTLASQIDLIENCELFKNIVVLQSSIKKLKQKNNKIFTKLKHIIELDPSKDIYIFPNDYCRETAISNTEDSDVETQQIVKALLWYKQKIHVEWVEMILISNNYEINKAVKKIDFPVQTIKEFAQHNFGKYPHLRDFIGVDESHDTQLDIDADGDLHFEFDLHLSEDETNSAIRNGTALKGKIAFNRNNIEEATVRTNFGFEVKVVGIQNLNRAIHGDLVAVELLDESEWLSSKLIEIADEDFDNKDDENGNLTGRTAESTTIQYKNLIDRIINTGLVPVGKIKGVVKRNLRNLAGQIKRLVPQKSGATYAEVGPVDPRYPNTLLLLSDTNTIVDQKIVFSVDRWPENFKYPLGHLVGIFGKAGDLNTESKVILFEHNVETRNFSQQVYNCLPAEGKNFKISDEERSKRQDLREYPICSVDPPGCKDIDDALHSRILPNGNIECGVHIADVTHFVRPETAIDKEAAFRSTTVYLVDRRTDMLPKLLTEDLCSLRSNVERLAFSCVWEMNPKTAEILSTRFHKSIINSRRAFTYQAAQELIDDKSQNNEITKSLRGLMDMSKLLKGARNKKGALTLASTQVKFQFDEETHNPTDVSFYNLMDTNSMVEEFMLLANISVAGKILEHYPGSSILRHHNPPKPKMIKDFGALVGALGYNFDYSSSRALAGSLDGIVRVDDPFFNKLARIMTTRCMNEAQYICTADFDFPEYKHYGLASELYTHFTSPIRRYADVLVHRLLAASIDIESLPRSMCNKHNLTKLCDNMNMRHRNARFASRASSDYFAFLFFKDRELRESAMISGIERNGVNVIIPKYGFEGFIEYNDQELEDNRKLIQDIGQNIVIQSRMDGKEFKIFDRLDIMLSMEMKHFRKQIKIRVAH